MQNAPNPLDVGGLARVPDESQTSLPSQINWEKYQPVQQAHLNVKSTQDRRECEITGMEFLHPNTLLLADSTNDCIKRVDVDTGDITGYLSLPASPWDITTLGRNQAAVTLPNIQSIHVISTQSNMSLLRTIKVDDDCRGICSTTDNKLVVTFTHPGKVQVLDEHSTMLCEMEGSADSKVQLYSPLHVLVVSENDNNLIYVSDLYTHILDERTDTPHLQRQRLN